MESTQQVTGGTNWCQCQSGKGFQAHAAPQGLRENLINALKLLRHQQKDGDGPIQSVARSVHLGSIKYNNIK